MEDNQTKSTLGRSILWLVVLAVIIVGGFALSKQKESEAIKIGVLSILSGDGAAWGESAKKVLTWRLKNTIIKRRSLAIGVLIWSMRIPMERQN